MSEDALLEFSKVSFISLKTSSLLIDVTFKLVPGENIILFGPENSGTELICPIIATIIEKFDGDVRFRGQSIKGLSNKEKNLFRKHLGYLQQDYGLISNLSVEENIALPLRYHTELSSRDIQEQVNELIDEMQLGHCRRLRPVSLTPSELLKTAFARAVALKPDLLLIEYPLEKQNPLNIQVFLKALKLRAEMENTAIVLITNSPEKFLDFSDKYFMLYNGNIVFAGDKNELLNSNNKYLKQYRDCQVDGPMVIL